MSEEPTTKEGVIELLREKIDQDRLAAVQAAKMCADHLMLDLDELKKEEPITLRVHPTVFIEPGGAPPAEALAEDGPSCHRMTSRAYGGAMLIALVHELDIDAVLAQMFVRAARLQLAQQGHDPDAFGVTEMLPLVFNSR